MPSRDFSTQEGTKSALEVLENEKMNMKLSDYVARFLHSKGVSTVFAVSGGASLHLIHSVAEHPDMSVICPHHEQAAAMAADGFARSTGELGVAIATSGPGATNLITGLCCSYYDSVPVLCITGQVSTFRQVGETGVRQIGFQETPIVDVTRSITKLSLALTDPRRIREYLEQAFYTALEGRPGPVLLDIPDNLQREMIDPETLHTFEPDDQSRNPSEVDYYGVLKNAILAADRPVLIAGWGLTLQGVRQKFVELANQTGIPVVSTWGAADILPPQHESYVGTFGTHGMRHANFAVQNSDLIISLGSRLDTKATGTPVNSFARQARKIVVDIDQSELDKFRSFDLEVEHLWNLDLNEFFAVDGIDQLHMPSGKFDKWKQKINQWRYEFSQIDDQHRRATSFVNPYIFFPTLTASLCSPSSVFVDTGCSLAWLMQSGTFKDGLRVYHDYNNTAMGWALPAAIGGYFADRHRNVTCIVGDGSFMMTMHELATVKHHGIPLKIFLINNNGYAMIRQTQDQWLASNYVASSQSGGLSFPNFETLAQAFDLDYYKIVSDQDTENALKDIYATPRACLCEVIVDEDSRVIPQVKFGKPNEDMEPLLDREIFSSSMLIEQL